MTCGFKHFSEICTDRPFEGDKIRLDEILNKEILILGFKIKDSKRKEGTKYLTIQFRIDNMDKISFTGSAVLQEQLEKYKESLPFYATIKKIQNYYTLT